MDASQTPRPARPSRVLIGATWQDAPHLSPEAKATLNATIHPQFRAARTRGIPHLGAGSIYQLPEQDIKCNPFLIPKHYRRGYGMDTGWNFTAALWGALDPDTDVLYITFAYKRATSPPSVHAADIKAQGAWMPGVGDAADINKLDGRQFIAVYKNDFGLDLTLPNKAVETGIQEVWERFISGRLKVFSSCEAFFEEYRFYRRDKNGKIVKKNDHLLDALRYLVMSGLARMIVQPVETRVIEDDVADDPGYGWMGR